MRGFGAIGMREVVLGWASQNVPPCLALRIEEIRGAYRARSLLSPIPIPFPIPLQNQHQHQHRHLLQQGDASPNANWTPNEPQPDQLRTNEEQEEEEGATRTQAHDGVDWGPHARRGLLREEQWQCSRPSRNHYRHRSELARAAWRSSRRPTILVGRHDRRVRPKE